jgi:hypothetical protein
MVEIRYDARRWQLEDRDAVDNRIARHLIDEGARPGDAALGEPLLGAVWPLLGTVGTAGTGWLGGAVERGDKQRWGPGKGVYIGQCPAPIPKVSQIGIRHTVLNLPSRVYAFSKNFPVANRGTDLQSARGLAPSGNTAATTLVQVRYCMPSGVASRIQGRIGSRDGTGLTSADEAHRSPAFSTAAVGQTDPHGARPGCGAVGPASALGPVRQHRRGRLGERGKLPCGVPHSPRRGSGHKVAAQEEFIFRFSFSHDAVDLVSHFHSSP